MAHKNNSPEDQKTKIPPPPLILAPAGDKASFLAALAAGTDEIYCGLKHLSARMEARNFLLEDLASLIQLAHHKGVRVFVALNSLLKNDDLHTAGGLLQQLERHVKPDGIILQDLSFIQLARQTGFSGELHLSTLSNFSFQTALQLAKRNLGVHRIVLPRELNIDEIKAVAAACPANLDLEVFVHGALCYGVSGRCYWSSHFGGKSGLRGRCVQPCRRIYTQKGQRKRYFSCRDLSLDVLVKVLLDVPKVRVWKIEGRRKGAHTVFYTVSAYKILRDHGTDPDMKKEALKLLSYSLGRAGTHYNFLPQRPQNPMDLKSHTASGLFVGNIKGTRQKPFLNPREELFPGDLLRLGYEDESWHVIIRVGKYIPKSGRYHLKSRPGKSLSKGIPVFLIDRQGKNLNDILSELEKNMTQKLGLNIRTAAFNVRMPKRSTAKKFSPVNIKVYRQRSKTSRRAPSGLWLSNMAVQRLPKNIWPRIWWWLPPVIWPEDEKKWKKLIDSALKKGSRNFVLNMPWQIVLFSNIKRMNLWAGPFCNIANVLALKTLASLGFKGAIVSPELGGKDYLILPKKSPLPLGAIISGHWPLCVSRVLPEHLKPGTAFTSPKGETAWIQKIESDYWVYPNWPLDLTAKQVALEKAGYRLFVHLVETIPKNVSLKKRPGLWNWELDLL